jgi:hypothetical protein
MGWKSIFDLPLLFSPVAYFKELTIASGRGGSKTQPQNVHNHKPTRNKSAPMTTNNAIMI